MNTDNKDFGPAFGLAWSPSFRAAAPSVLDPQDGALDKTFRNPYTERWSFGFQRELSRKALFDAAYVGSESHGLTTWADVNPRQLNGQYLHPEFGPRLIRTSQGNSSYHAMQLRLDRGFDRGFQVDAAYTWSRNMDSTSEGVGNIDNQTPGGEKTSIPVSDGGLRLDHGPSNYDRRHRLTVTYVWNVPVPSGRFWKPVLGGWSIAGISSFQSGAPFTVANGFDRNNDGILNDRPDIGNPQAPINTRAVVTPASGSQFCATGYRNPDTGLCVTPSEVHWVQGIGLPNASTVGRNTLVAGGIRNFDLTLTKSFQIREQQRLDFRWEAFNIFNHPQFTQIPERTVFGSPSPQAGLPSRFLNRDFTDSGICSMWVQVKVLF